MWILLGFEVININKRILEDDNVEINDRLRILKAVLKNVENKRLIKNR